MKLEVGQFVRFKDKRGNTYIRNIKEVCNEQPHKSWGGIIIDKNANNVPYVSLKNIIKASYNIIDLISVGDEVDDGLELENGWIYFEHEIETIVTKEQFEQVAYKVGE